MDKKRLGVWLISFALALPVTYVLLVLTQIPFIEGGVFTLLSLLLVAFFFMVIIDSVVKAGVLDERGWHLGLRSQPKSFAKTEDEPRDPTYKPIVSREQRLKEQSNKTA
jgi:hypothetical protein